jgi:hypothetical protein
MSEYKGIKEASPEVYAELRECLLKVVYSLGDGIMTEEKLKRFVPDVVTVPCIVQLHLHVVLEK